MKDTFLETLINRVMSWTLTQEATIQKFSSIPSKVAILSNG
jgi:hypothetical protein